VNRYDEILTRMVVAQIAADYEPLMAVRSEKLRAAAAVLEEYFALRDQARFAKELGVEGAPVPALLRRQAE
jgi:hypothetical protein